MLHVQTRLFLNLTAGADYPLREIAELHAELADAIRAGDATRAEQLGGSHNTRDGEAISARYQICKGSDPFTYPIARISGAGYYGGGLRRAAGGKMRPYGRR